jgi:hypothetical protein
MPSPSLSWEAECSVRSGIVNLLQNQRSNGESTSHRVGSRSTSHDEETLHGHREGDCDEEERTNGITTSDRFLMPLDAQSMRTVGAKRSANGGSCVHQTHHDMASSHVGMLPGAVHSPGLTMAYGTGVYGSQVLPRVVSGEEFHDDGRRHDRHACAQEGSHVGENDGRGSYPNKDAGAHADESLQHDRADGGQGYDGAWRHDQDCGSGSGSISSKREHGEGNWSGESQREGSAPKRALREPPSCSSMDETTMKSHVFTPHAPAHAASHAHTHVAAHRAGARPNSRNRENADKAAGSQGALPMLLADAHSEIREYAGTGLGGAPASTALHHGDEGSWARCAKHDAGDTMPHGGESAASATWYRVPHNHNAHATHGAHGIIPRGDSHRTVDSIMSENSDVVKSSKRRSSELHRIAEALAVEGSNAFLQIIRRENSALSLLSGSSRTSLESSRGTNSVPNDMVPARRSSATSVIVKRGSLSGKDCKNRTRTAEVRMLATLLLR